jgi:hypothetical protein
MSTSTIAETIENPDYDDTDEFYTVIDQEFRVTNKQSAFYNEVLTLTERIPWRNGTVSLHLSHPVFGELSFDSADCEFHNAIRRKVPYPENYVITRHDNGNPE